jgi:hypothetical protein
MPMASEGFLKLRLPWPGLAVEKKTDDERRHRSGAAFGYFSFATVTHSCSDYR